MVFSIFLMNLNIRDISDTLHILVDIDETQNLFPVILLEISEMSHVWGTLKFDSSEVCTDLFSQLEDLSFKICLRQIEIPVGVQEQFRNGREVVIMVTAKVTRPSS